ncbi:hypothetical protein J2797_005164 [Paraburkholderia terricola]|nr:hypothetical protein [Paraburkholderia terricola]
MVWTPPPGNGTAVEIEMQGRKVERPLARVCESKNTHQPFFKENPE